MIFKGLWGPGFCKVLMLKSLQYKTFFIFYLTTGHILSMFIYITLINTKERKIMSYDHKASAQRLNEIMREDYNATRMPGEQIVPKKVDIIDALAEIQSAYTKAGREIPSFSDSMALIALKNSV